MGLIDEVIVVLFCKTFSIVTKHTSELLWSALFGYLNDTEYILTILMPITKYWLLFNWLLHLNWGEGGWWLCNHCQMIVEHGCQTWREFTIAYKSEGLNYWMSLDSIWYEKLSKNIWFDYSKRDLITHYHLSMKVKELVWKTFLGDFSEPIKVA